MPHSSRVNKSPQNEQGRGPARQGCMVHRAGPPGSSQSGHPFKAKTTVQRSKREVRQRGQAPQRWVSTDKRTATHLPTWWREVCDLLRRKQRHRKNTLYRLLQTGALGATRHGAGNSQKRGSKTKLLCNRGGGAYRKQTAAPASVELCLCCKGAANNGGRENPGPWYARKGQGEAARDTCHNHLASNQTARAGWPALLSARERSHSRPRCVPERAAATRRSQPVFPSCPDMEGASCPPR